MAEDAAHSPSFLLHIAHRTSSNMVRELPTLDTNFIRARRARAVPSVASRGAHPARTRPRVFRRSGVSPETRRREIPLAAPRDGDAEARRGWRGVAASTRRLLAAYRARTRVDVARGVAMRPSFRPSRRGQRARTRRKPSRVSTGAIALATPSTASRTSASRFRLRSLSARDAPRRRTASFAPLAAGARDLVRAIARFLGFCQEAGPRRRVRRLIRDSTPARALARHLSIDTPPNIT